MNKLNQLKDFELGTERDMDLFSRFFPIPKWTKESSIKNIYFLVRKSPKLGEEKIKQI
jgi:hypothetical protein